MLLACDPMDKDEPSTADKTQQNDNKGDEKDKPQTKNKMEKDDNKESEKDKPQTKNKMEKDDNKESEKDKPSTPDKTEKADDKGDETPITAARSHPITIDDTNDNDAIEAGETITLAFNKAVKIASPTTNVKVGTTAGKTDKTFGTDATIAGVNADEQGFAAKWQITLGTSPDVAAGNVIEVAKEHVTDKAGNNPASNISFTVPKWAQKLTTATSATGKLGGKIVRIVGTSDKDKAGASGAWSYAKERGSGSVNAADGSITPTGAGDFVLTVARAADAKYAAILATEVTVTFSYIQAGGVVWSGDEGKKLWAAANAYCDSLAKYGKNTWRLPTLDELRALYKEYPRDRVSHLLGWNTGIYRTSTPYKTRDDAYYGILFASGSEFFSRTTDNDDFACVAAP